MFHSGQGVHARKWSSDIFEKIRALFYTQMPTGTAPVGLDYIILLSQGMENAKKLLCEL